MSPFRIGFCGAWSGLSGQQTCVLRNILLPFGPGYFFHHGAAPGADEEAHEIAADFKLVQIVHPTNIEKHAGMVMDGLWRPPKSTLVRYYDVVDAADWMLAMPDSATCDHASYVWNTINYARRRNKRLTVIQPNGDPIETWATRTAF